MLFTLRSISLGALLAAALAVCAFAQAVSPDLSTGTPTGAAGGALSGTYPDPLLATSQGQNITWTGKQIFSYPNTDGSGNNNALTINSSATDGSSNDLVILAPLGKAGGETLTSDTTTAESGNAIVFTSSSDAGAFGQLGFGNYTKGVAGNGDIFLASLKNVCLSANLAGTAKDFCINTSGLTQLPAGINIPALSVSLPVCTDGSKNLTSTCPGDAPVLSGTTGSIGGGVLLAGACTSGTVSVASSTTAMAVAATPVTYPGDGVTWAGYVSTAGTVTVKVCAIVGLTPGASTYNVRVIQ